MGIDYSKSGNPRLERIKRELEQLSPAELNQVKKQAEMIYARSYNIAEVSFDTSPGTIRYGAVKTYEYKIPKGWGKNVSYVIVDTPKNGFVLVKVLNIKSGAEQRFQGRLKWAISYVSQFELDVYEDRKKAEHFLYD